MSQIIEGVHCDVSQQELKAHCQKRVEFHTGKLKHWQELLTAAANKKAQEITAQDADELARNKMSGYSSTSPLDEQIERCRRKVTTHKVALARFRFWGEHLPEGATFRLSMSDLSSLELTDE
jgi:hypothetical protein